MIGKILEYRNQRSKWQDDAQASSHLFTVCTSAQIVSPIKSPWGKLSVTGTFHAWFLRCSFDSPSILDKAFQYH